MAAQGGKTTLKSGAGQQECIPLNFTTCGSAQFCVMENVMHLNTWVSQRKQMKFTAPSALPYLQREGGNNLSPSLQMLFKHKLIKVFQRYLLKGHSNLLDLQPSLVFQIS